LSPAALPGTIKWNVAAFSTRSDNDILLVATPVNGFGYFRNAGTTQRRGIDANLQYHGTALRLQLGYSLLDATFRDSLILSSNSPSADADGVITVSPGNRIPMLPRQRVTLSADYDLTRNWRLGADLRWQSSMILAGDESNQQPPLPGYATVNVHAGWKIRPGAEISADVENLFDQRYDSYGAFTQLDGLPPGLNLTNPRTYSPGEPRSVTVGLKIGFR
jgi:iron complex outermembrane receptor protein